LADQANVSTLSFYTAHRRHIVGNCKVSGVHKDGLFSITRHGHRAALLSRTPLPRADDGGSQVIARSPWSARQTPTIFPARANNTFSKVIAGPSRARNAAKNKSTSDPPTA